MTNRLLTADELRLPLRRLALDGVLTQAVAALTAGPFLVAFAMLCGASNATIGIIAALPPAALVLQVPAVLLIERLGHRKPLVVFVSFVARLCLFVVGALPWFVDRANLVTALIGVLAVHFALTAISTCAYSSWVRDLVPDEASGRHFGRQLAIGTAVGAVLRLGAGPVLDHWPYGDPIGAYIVLFGLAAAFGAAGSIVLSRVPEPALPEARARTLRAVLTEPLRHPNFRRLIVFTASWSFAINIAAPFVTVYMLRRLELTMTGVIALSVVSKLVNVAFFNVWGRLADRFSSRSALSVAVAMSVFCIALWPFTTAPERHAFSIPLLVFIHLVAGVSTAGVDLCAKTLVLKAAPRGQATPFLAAHAVVAGVAAMAAPILAGVLVDVLADEHLTVSLSWTSAAGQHVRLLVDALDFQGIDFLFVASFFFGLYSLHRLLAVREEGQVDERIVLSALLLEVRQAIREVSTIAGVRELAVFPHAFAHRPKRRRSKPQKKGKKKRRTTAPGVPRA